MSLNTLLLVINTLVINLFYRRPVHTVVQLVEALSCNPECSLFRFPMVSVKLSIDIIQPALKCA